MTKVRHWKHGWIPVSPEAKAFVLGKGPNPTGPKIIGKPGGNGKVPSLAKIAAADLQGEISRNGGFTYDPKTNGLLEVGKAKGFAVAVPGTEEVVGTEKVNATDISREAFARGVARVLTKHRDKIANGAVLGGWYSPERNQYMVELTNIVPPEQRDHAIKLGKERNQEAIFDLSTGETIFTGGTGDAPRQGDYDLALSVPKEPLKPEETAAVKYYTGPGFTPLNGALRQGKELPPQIAFYKAHLDAAIAKSVVKKDTKVYRGITSGPWLTDIPPGYNPGDTYIDHGYLSTATGGGPPKKYKADVPAGTHALDVHGTKLTHHPEENEMLLPAGTPLQIQADFIRDGQRVIKARVAA